MLKSVMICTAFATFAIIPSAKAQFPGPTYIGRCMQDPDCAYQHRNDWGQAYGEDRYNYNSNNIPGDRYQPYTNISPTIRPLEDYGIGRSHSYGGYGGDDD